MLLPEDPEPIREPGAAPPQPGVASQPQEAAPVTPGVWPPVPDTTPQPLSATPQHAAPRGSRSCLLLLVAAILGGIVGAAAIGAGFYAFVVPQLSTEGPATGTSTEGGVASPVNIDVSEGDLGFAEAVALKVTPSVVSVAVEQTGFNPFTGQTVTQTVGNGSGVIIRSDGYILTNYHVVEGADGVTVTIGVEDLPAEVVASDPSSDLAVLKVDRADLPAVEIGSSADLAVGQPVVAIGSPFGLDQSVTTGIISALGRTSFSESAQAALTAYTSLIQTDAAINPGNSGGALTDAEGRLIGINTLIQTGSEYANQSAGVGFAIPIDYAIAVANELISTGRVVHPYLGISTMTINPAMAARYGLPVDAGAIVDSVAPGSPGEEAGIQVGDIIVRVGDAEIAGVGDVFVAIRSHDVGDELEVEIVRGEEKQVLTVTLGSEASR